MPPRRSIKRALKEYSSFKSWDFNSDEKLPKDLHWMKVKAPNGGEVFRWDGYQKCDIVLVRLEDRPPEYGMIVHAYDRDGKGPECVISWIYDRPRARKEFFYDWPEDVKYLLSNHFQLINSESLIRQAEWIVRDELHKNNYNWGINFGSNKLDTFDESDNCIIKARKSMELSGCQELPAELRIMVFEDWKRSEESKDDHIKAKQTGPNSCSHCSGRRSKQDQWRQERAVNQAVLFDKIRHCKDAECSRWLVKEWNRAKNISELPRLAVEQASKAKRSSQVGTREMPRRDRCSLYKS